MNNRYLACTWKERWMREKGNYEIDTRELKDDVANMPGFITSPALTNKLKLVTTENQAGQLSLHKISQNEIITGYGRSKPHISVAITLKPYKQAIK